MSTAPSTPNNSSHSTEAGDRALEHGAVHRARRTNLPALVLDTDLESHLDHFEAVAPPVRMPVELPVMVPPVNFMPWVMHR